MLAGKIGVGCQYRERAVRQDGVGDRLPAGRQRGEAGRECRGSNW
jgi:hypothetical protein